MIEGSSVEPVNLFVQFLSQSLTLSNRHPPEAPSGKKPIRGALDVALLEGLSGEWEERDYRDVLENVIGRQMLVREAEAWHPHQPYAEREKHEQFERLPNDPEL